MTITSTQLEMGLQQALERNLAADRIAEAIRAVAKSHEEFTSDIVAAQLTVPTVDLLRLRPNTMGAVFRSLARAGVIERTGAFVQTTRPEGRCRLIPLWRAKG